jgi:hypothetical protein
MGSPVDKGPGSGLSLHWRPGCGNFVRGRCALGLIFLLEKATPSCMSAADGAPRAS